MAFDERRWRLRHGSEAMGGAANLRAAVRLFRGYHRAELAGRLQTRLAAIGRE